MSKMLENMFSFPEDATCAVDLRSREVADSAMVQNGQQSLEANMSRKVLIVDDRKLARMVTMAQSSEVDGR